MTITINLSPDEEKRLRERAAMAGLDVETCVHEMLSQSLHYQTDWDEALAPFRRQVEESGMSDEQLMEFFEGVRDKVWQEKTGRGR